MPHKTKLDLDSIGREVLSHWQKFRPNLYKKLLVQGTPCDRLVEAQKQVGLMHEELFKAGWSGPEANNLAMREWVFLPDIGDESENEQSAGEVDDGLA